MLALRGPEAEVAAVPAGLATRLPESGAGLPAGLRRRGALARAAPGGPWPRFIDEAVAGPRSRAAPDRVPASRPAGLLVAAPDSAWVAGADAVRRPDGGGGRADPASATAGMGTRPGPGAAVPLPRRPAAAGRA